MATTFDELLTAVEAALMERPGVEITELGWQLITWVLTHPNASAAAKARAEAMSVTWGVPS